jgi:hypothetical protein
MRFLPPASALATALELAIASTVTPSGQIREDAVARLQRQIDSGSARLTFNFKWGYLPAVLTASLRYAIPGMAMGQYFRQNREYRRCVAELVQAALRGRISHCVRNDGVRGRADR